MNRLSSIALSAALAVVGVGASVSAEARPYVAVGCPGGLVAERVGYARPYFAPYYTHGRYWHREIERERFDRFRHEHGERRW
jgi:hypothetical protein